MSCVINFYALINHVTNDNRFFMKDMKLPVTSHQKKKDLNHFIYLNSKYLNNKINIKQQKIHE